MSWSLLLVSMALLPSPADDAPADAAKLQGTWTLVAAERSGKPAEEQKIKNTKLIIEGDTIAVRETREDGQGEPRDEKATFKLDPTTTPKSIDLRPAKRDGGQEQGPLPGIYELSGDDLKLCWQKAGPGGGERPKDFNTKDQPGRILMVLKRQKKP